MYGNRRNTTQKSCFSMSFKKRIARLVLASVMALFVICLTHWSSIYAFFSDGVNGYETINAAKLDVKVTSVMAMPLTYGGGKGTIYDLENGTWKNATYSADTGIILSDGYIMPFKFKMKNTSNIKENLTAQISFAWQNWLVDGSGGDRDISTEGLFYIYSINADDDKIHSGEEFPIGSISDGLWTDSTVYENIAPNGEVEVSYKIYFKRSDELNRANAKQTGDSPKDIGGWKYYRGTLGIKPVAKAQLPDNIAPNWYANDNSKLCNVVTNVYAYPKIGDYTLESDNKNLSNNKITAVTSTASTNSTWPIIADPTNYMITRTGTFIQDGQEPIVESKEYDIKSGESFVDTDIEWLTSYKYGVTSYDDYDNPIASFDNDEDVCGGGLIEIPDSTLRRWLKCYAYGVLQEDAALVSSLAVDYPVTKAKVTFTVQEP